jgi:hypothetical protein
LTLQETANDVKSNIACLIPDESTDKHFIYSYLELILGKGVNGGLVDDYISLLLENAKNKSIGLIQHHYFEYKDVGLKEEANNIPDALFSRVSE